MSKWVRDNMYSFWQRAFLGGRDAKDMGIARFFFYSYLFAFFFVFDNYTDQFMAMGQLGPHLWRPVSFFQWFDASSLGLLCSSLFLWSFALGLLMSALGLFFTFSSWVAFISGLIVIGMPNNFGTIYDSTTLVCVVLGILPFTHASHFSSLDKRFGLIKGFSDRPEWGLQLISSLIFFFYLCSGIQKVRLGGLDYFSTHNLSMALVFNGSPVGKQLATIEGLEKLLKVLGVVFQLSAIIPLFYKRLRPLFAIFFLSFHVTVDYSMQVHFSIFKIIYVFIFPWHQFWADLKYFFKGTQSPAIARIYGKGVDWVAQSVSTFVFLMASLSVASFIHFWPFSTTTMYAYSEDYPYDEYNLFLRYEGESDHHLVMDPDYFPIDRTKAQLLIRKQLREYKNISLVVADLYAMFERGHKQKLQSLEVRRCYYYSLEDMIRFYPHAKSCERITSWNPRSKGL